MVAPMGLRRWPRASATTALRTRLDGSRIPPGLVYAIAPLLLFVVETRLRTDDILHAGALIVGAGIVLVAARRPGPAVLALTVFVIFQPLTLGLLYEWGLPAEIVRSLTFTKEGLIAGIAIAGWRRARATGHSLDRLEKLLLAFASLTLLYFVLPMIAAAGAPTDLQSRLLGLRTNLAYFALFLGVRHAVIPAVWRRRFVITVVLCAIVIAGFGFWQYLDTAGFRDFMVNTVGTFRYQTDILGLPADHVRAALLEIAALPLRTGSIYISTFDFADLSLIALALCLEAASRRRANVGWFVIIAGLMLALLSTHTRGDVYVAVLVFAASVRPRSTGDGRARVRLALMIAAGLLIIVPSLSGTRFTGQDGGAQSNADHRSSLQRSFDQLVANPLGQGLGTSPAAGERAGPLQASSISESAYLQVGNELGVAALLLFVAILAMTMRLLFVEASRNENDSVPGMAVLAMLGMLAVAFTHHAFLSISHTWTLWALAGLALNRTGARSELPSVSPSGARPDHTTSAWNSATI